MNKNDKTLIDRRAAFTGNLLNHNSIMIPDVELIDWAVREGLGSMTYYRFHDRLQGDGLEKCRRQYRWSSVQDLKFSTAYTEMQLILESAEIDYIPLKGMALIRQKVYDFGTLRLHCDIDILLRSENDCRRAFDLLSAAGWKYSGQQDFYQHIPALHKNGIAIELHHHLPGMDDENNINEFWQKDAKQVDKNEYHFPIELHFALAFAHCGNHHDWEAGAKFLLDAGLLMKVAGFDLQKCVAYCHQFGIGKPEVLLTSFPEIFGESDCTENSSQLLRERVLGEFVPYIALEVAAKDRFRWTWWCRHVSSLKFSRLRGRYNAENAPWYKMLSIMCKDILSKSGTVCRYMFSSGKAAERKLLSDACREELGINMNPNKL